MPVPPVAAPVAEADPEVEVRRTVLTAAAVVGRRTADQRDVPVLAAAAPAAPDSASAAGSASAKDQAVRAATGGLGVVAAVTCRWPAPAGW